MFSQMYDMQKKKSLHHNNSFFSMTSLCFQVWIISVHRNTLITAKIKATHQEVSQ